jgi:hypothetical protein
MKKALILLALLIPVIGLSQEPVQWNFSVEKIKSNQYKVRLTARIQSGYHVFALKQPEDAIVNPTKINFTRNPVVRVGDFSEEGTMEKVRDADLDIESWHFSDKVDFVGVVTLKSSNVKTVLAGHVEFQVCNSNRCYPPAKVNFTLPLNH